MDQVVIELEDRTLKPAYLIIGFDWDMHEVVYSEVINYGKTDKQMFDNAEECINQRRKEIGDRNISYHKIINNDLRYCNSKRLGWFPDRDK